MTEPGPLIEITRSHTKEGSDGGKILVITSAGKAFINVRPKNKGATNTEPTLEDKIRALDAVLFLMYDRIVTANSGIVVRLHNGVDPEVAAKVIAETINAHHGWLPSDPMISPEETFWRGSPMH